MATFASDSRIYEVTVQSGSYRRVYRHVADRKLSRSELRREVWLFYEIPEEAKIVKVRSEVLRVS